MLQKSFGMMCWLACIMGVGVIPSLDQGCIVRDSRVALIIVNKRRGARARSGGRISSNSSPVTPVNPMPENAIVGVPKTSETAGAYPWTIPQHPYGYINTTIAWIGNKLNRQARMGYATLYLQSYVLRPTYERWPTSRWWDP